MHIIPNSCSGTGYTILDPESGAGGSDGGFLLWIGKGRLTASALLYSAVPAKTTVLRMVILLLALASTIVFLLV